MITFIHKTRQTSYKHSCFLYFANAKRLCAPVAENVHAVDDCLSKLCFAWVFFINLFRLNEEKCFCTRFFFSWSRLSRRISSLSKGMRTLMSCLYLFTADLNSVSSSASLLEKNQFEPYILCR